jgi:predicted GNAT family acetyltransferase
VQVRHFDDPGAFLERAGPLLLADEARHNLLLGICGRLARRPDRYPGFGLWLGEGNGEVVACAARTPPWNLVVARPASHAAMAELARALAEEGADLPGVNGARPEVEVFARAWELATGKAARARMELGVYALAAVRPVVGVPGRLRPAGAEDRDILLEWATAFQAEALPHGSPADVAQMVDLRLADPAEGWTLWEDPIPVSMASFGGVTPNGVRIGPVYTPPELRGRGYASALVAGTSQQLLDGGKRFCFLFTDLANPTSNKIYRDIGYEFVCESADIEFGVNTR